MTDGMADMAERFFMVCLYYDFGTFIACSWHVHVIKIDVKKMNCFFVIRKIISTFAANFSNIESKYES